MNSRPFSIESVRGPDLEVFENEPLSKHSYYQIGGPAEVFLIPKSMEALRKVQSELKESGRPFWILGNGSNILVSDKGLPGVVIKTTRLNLDIEPVTSKGPEESMLIKVGASLPNSMLLRRAAREGWSGFEFLAGVPGCVGGAVFMNAGTNLGEVANFVFAVEVFNLKSGETKTFHQQELGFEYRKNKFLSPGDLVLSAIFKVVIAEPESVNARIQEVLTKRKGAQPIELPSCGSVFKNPKASGLHAWQVVDQLGFRGVKVGGAQVSPKHTNFIINTGGASASDVKALIDQIKAKAKSKLHIDLEEEVQFLGEF